MIPPFAAQVVTKTERVVAHFFHRDFERCRIMDKHLQVRAVLCTVPCYVPATGGSACNKWQCSMPTTRGTCFARAFPARPRRGWVPTSK